MRSESLKKAQQKYRQSLKRFSITFYQTDKDIEEHLYKQENKQGYVKDLIREDMKKNKGEPK
jgi:hypothetical protein